MHPTLDDVEFMEVIMPGDFITSEITAPAKALDPPAQSCDASAFTGARREKSAGSWHLANVAIRYPYLP